MSHEQRAHLMAISNYAEIILSEAQKKKFNLKYIKENAQNVLKENSFLKFLLNDFFFESRLLSLFVALLVDIH